MGALANEAMKKKLRNIAMQKAMQYKKQAVNQARQAALRYSQNAAKRAQNAAKQTLVKHLGNTNATRNLIKRVNTHINNQRSLLAKKINMTAKRASM